MGPSFHLRMPPGWFFKFPPDDIPLAIPPPTDARTFASPFPIDATLYNDVLDWKVPVTIGALYATTAMIMNKINRDRGNKAWGFSKARAFRYFVVAHNLFLAVFSALTFFGMIRALAHTWPAKRDHHDLFGKIWPGLRTENGLAGAADALCKMHGPRGYGDATYYLPFEQVWENKNKLMHLAGAGSPDPMDVGRLWNEGLAFWGWWFYLSKFYEVLDTFIILAKGKRSSTLQTYHHAGAMMCMWAGIRFMSPPIWMFVFLNSGIHTMMYIYYTLSAVGVKVPQRVKRTLTTLQISQFIIGITFAALHLFVTYSVPVQVPYTIVHAITSTVPEAASSVSSALSAATSVGIAAWLKKVAFRAAGEEGLAENVRNDKGEPFGLDALAPPPINRGETLFRTQYETIPCIDTSGQAFAIWLNLAYLAPLTGLFVRFFIRSYSRRGAGAKHQTHRGKGSKAAADAAHGVDHEMDKLGKSAEDGLGDLGHNVKRVIRNGTPSNKGTPTNKALRVSPSIERQREKFEPKTEDASRNESPYTPSLRKNSSTATDKLRDFYESGENRSVDSFTQSGANKATNLNAEAVKENMSPFTDDAMERLKEVADASVKATKEALGVVRNAYNGEGEFKSFADEVAERAQHVKEQISDSTSTTADDEPSSSQRADSFPSSEPPFTSAQLERSTSQQSWMQSQQRPGERSPKRSKIPQPANTRSRSPIQKLAAATAPTDRPKSRARLTASSPTKSDSLNTNGTKQQNPPPKEVASAAASSNGNTDAAKKDDAQPFDGGVAFPSTTSESAATSGYEKETNNNGKQGRSPLTPNSDDAGEGARRVKAGGRGMEGSLLFSSKHFDGLEDGDDVGTVLSGEKGVLGGLSY